MNYFLPPIKSIFKRLKMNNTLPIFLLLFLLSCNSTQPQTEPNTTIVETAPSLNFVPKVLKKESSTCATDSMKCASVSLEYLIAENAAEAVLKNINDTLIYYYANAVNAYGEAGLTTNPDISQAGDGFIKDYEQFLREEGGEGFITPWTIEIESTVEHLSDTTACIMYGTYTYTGGAHPNHFVTLLNFDVKTGQKLTAKDYVKNQEKLTTIAEPYFRKAREIESNQPLEELGFFWGEIFSLPQNMGLAKEGLKLYYNPYEAASYVLGPTEFTIPYEELEGVIVW